MSEGTKASVQPLNESAASALAAYGARAGLSAEVKTALRARISASVAAEAAPPIEVAPKIDVRRSVVRISVAIAAAAAVLLAIRFVAFDRDGAVRQGAEDAPQAPYGAQPDDAGGRASARVPAVDDPETARDGAASQPTPGHVPESPEPAPLEAVDGAAPAGPTAIPDGVVPVPATTKQRPRRKPPASSSEPEPVDTTLAAELELMRLARAALRRGDPEAALRTLSRHASEFADGQLLEDRKALRVQALCDAGLVDEARVAARAFAKAHSGSLHVGRVKKICEKS